MKIGLMGGLGAGQDNSINGIIEFAKRIESMGFDNLWMANIFSFDAINVLSLIGRETSTIELGTAVVPSYPRHPSAMAQQALTASAASDGRFVLGLGLSHKMVIEDMLGMSYDKPAKHMKEYLEVLMPLLAGEETNFDGDQYRVHCQLSVEGAKPVPTVVAALGPIMLKIAGTMTDGTTTWMTGQQTLAEHIVPSITKAASEANRAAPRIVAGLPIVLTSDIDAAREKIDTELEVYGLLPSYRAMLDREGVAGPSGIAVLGDEAALREQLQRFRDAGVTDFNAAIINIGDDSFERTLAFLQTEIG